jgi:hypothetical protein
LNNDRLERKCAPTPNAADGAASGSGAADALPLDRDLNSTTNLKQKAEKTGARPTWQAVKARLRGLDTPALLDLIHDLYSASIDNRRFLHGRLVDPTRELGKYRELISEAVFPNPLGRKPIRIEEAQRLIRHYERATGDVTGTVDLLLTFVAVGTDQAADLGYGNDAYFNALERKLRSAVNMVPRLGAEDFAKAREELLWIRNRAKNIGWGFSDAVDALTASVVESSGSSSVRLRRPRSNI